MTDDMQHILDRLTDEQVETLRHVYAHKGSKEIARIMAVSPHTVDQRMRRALKKLGVNSRVEAARLLASHGVFQHVTPYQSLRYQPDNLAVDADSAHVAVGSADTQNPVYGDAPRRADQQIRVDAGQDDERGAAAQTKIWMLWLVLILVIGVGAVAILYFLLVTLAV